MHAFIIQKIREMRLKFYEPSSGSEKSLVIIAKENRTEDWSVESGADNGWMRRKRSV